MWNVSLDVAEHEQRVVPEIRHDGDLRKRPDDEHRQSEQEVRVRRDGDSNGRRQRDRHVRDRGDMRMGMRSTIATIPTTIEAMIPAATVNRNAITTYARYCFHAVLIDPQRRRHAARTPESA